MGGEKTTERARMQYHEHHAAVTGCLWKKTAVAEEARAILFIVVLLFQLCGIEATKSQLDPVSGPH